MADSPDHDELQLIIGRNAVIEAIKAGRPINRILIAKGTGGSIKQKILVLAKDRRIPVVEVDRRRLDVTTGDGLHQGVIAFGSPIAYKDPEEILALARSRGEAPLVAVLNGILDPQNLGAILRTSSAAGVHGVIIRERRQVGLTPAVARASAGGIEYVHVARVPNIINAVRWLKDNGLWVVASHAEADETLWNVDLSGPLAVVVGGEDAGVGPALLKECDLAVRIPMQPGRVTSLNASVAYAILIYEVMRQRMASS